MNSISDHQKNRKENGLKGFPSAKPKKKYPQYKNTNILPFHVISEIDYKKKD